MQTRKRRSAIIIALGALTLLLGVAAAPAAGTRGAREVKQLKYGTIVRLAPSTLMVVGRALDAAHGQPERKHNPSPRSGCFTWPMS